MNTMLRCHALLKYCAGSGSLVSLHCHFYCVLYLFLFVRGCGDLSHGQRKKEHPNESFFLKIVFEKYLKSCCLNFHSLESLHGIIVV